MKLFDIKLYKKNISFFKEREPSIYKLIKENKNFIPVEKIEKKAPDVELIMIPSLSSDIDTNSAKKWIHDKVMYEWDNVLKRYLDFEDLKKEVQKNKYIPLVLLYGLNSGNAIDILEKNEIEYDYLIIFEPDIKEFIISLYTVDWEKIFSRNDIFFILGDKEDFVKEGFINYFSFYSPINAVLFLAISFYKERNKDFSQFLEKVILLSMKGWGYYDDEKEALIHVYENLNEKVKYLREPKKLEKNTNVIIVGSGPSLDETIDFIKSNKDKAVIFSCGTAIHKLQKEGIVPDFQIELERPKERVKYFTNLPEDYRKQITILAADVVPKELLSLYKDAIVFPREFAMTQFLLNPKYYPVGITPTVTNTALGLATFLGFENIYLVGVDMGYRNIEKKHATGTIYGEITEESEFSKYIKVKGNVDKYVYTDDIFFWAKNNLEASIKSFKNRNFINISRGATIEGTSFVYDYRNLKLSYFDKEKFLKNILNNKTNNYKEIFHIEKKDYLSLAFEFINKVKKNIKCLLNDNNLKDRISFLYAIREEKKRLAIEDKAVATLLGGSIMHLQIKLIYFAYLAHNLSKEEKNILISSLDYIKKDLQNLEPYFDFYNQLY